MATIPNSKLAAEAALVTVNTNYAVAASDPARVQLLMDLIAAESVDDTTVLDRLFLDEMSPLARKSLYAHLVKLKASVT